MVQKKSGMGVGLKIVLIVIAMVVALAFAKDYLIKSAVIVGAKAVLGVDVEIGSFSLAILTQSVKIKDFKVFNPEGFSQDVPMVDIPEIAVQVDLFSLLKDTLHVPYVRFDFKEAYVITNADGLTNVNALTLATTGGEKAKEKKMVPVKTISDKKDKKMKMQFDLISVNIGRVITEDYTRDSNNPKRTEFNLNIKNKEYRNITSPTQLGATLMMAALLPVGLDSVFSLGTGAVGSTVDIVSGTAGALTGAAGSLLGGFKNSIKGALE